MDLYLILNSPLDTWEVYLDGASAAYYNGPNWKIEMNLFSSLEIYILF